MKIIRHYFNMVEVALAMAVVGLGIAGIMSLFPVGLNASRDAVADNYCSDSADQLLHYLASTCQNNWSVADGLPTTPPTINDTDTGTNWTAPVQTDGNLYDNSANGTNLTPECVYGIRQGTAQNTDFIAHLKLWKSQLTADYWTGAGAATPVAIPYSNACRINLEISWPVGKPYSKREKRIYSIEVFNPN